MSLYVVGGHVTQLSVKFRAPMTRATYSFYWCFVDGGQRDPIAPKLSCVSSRSPETVSRVPCPRLLNWPQKTHLTWKRL